MWCDVAQGSGRADTLTCTDSVSLCHDGVRLPVADGCWMDPTFIWRDFGEAIKMTFYYQMDLMRD